MGYALAGLDLKKINKCVGNPDADEENPVLKAEQDAQVNNIINSVEKFFASCPGPYSELSENFDLYYFVCYLRLARARVGT